MEKEFVTYELALRMKALAYDEPCFGVYPENGGDIILCGSTDRIRPKLKHILAPTWQSAFAWFEEEYNISSFIEKIFKDEYGYTITSNGYEPINGFDLDTKQEAQQACLEKLCEIVEGIKSKK